MAGPAATAVGIGTAVNIYGQYQAGQYAFNSAVDNAKITQQLALYNASIINMQAQYQSQMALATGQAMGALARQKAAADANVLRANAAIATNNARAAEDNAAVAREQAQFNADKIRQRNRLLHGKQVAAFGKAGVTMQGSAKDVMYDSAINGEIDALVAIYTGKIISTRYENEKQNKEYEAGILSQQADTTLSIGNNQAAWSEYQGSVSSILSLWEGQQRSGLTLWEGDIKANLIMMEGRQARTASYFGMASSLTSGGANMAMMFA